MRVMVVDTTWFPSSYMYVVHKLGGLVRPPQSSVGALFRLVLLIPSLWAGSVSPVTFSLCIDRLWQAFASETYCCYINKVSVNLLPVNGWNKGNRHIDTSTTFNIMYITYSARLSLFTERNSKLQYTKIIHYIWIVV